MAGTFSETTRWQAMAMAMACRPELQNRLIDIPAVGTGKPPRIAASRVTDHMAGDIHTVGAGVVEGAPVGLAQARTGRGDDDSFRHSDVPFG